MVFLTLDQLFSCGFVLDIVHWLDRSHEYGIHIARANRQLATPLAFTHAEQSRYLLRYFYFYIEQNRILFLVFFFASDAYATKIYAHFPLMLDADKFDTT